MFREAFYGFYKDCGGLPGFPGTLYNRKRLLQCSGLDSGKTISQTMKYEDLQQNTDNIPKTEGIIIIYGCAALLSLI